MQIVYTCPRCGADLQQLVLTSFPPQHLTRCNQCGWEHIEREEVTRVPFPSSKLYSNYSKLDNVPEACKYCSNHPSNGGSGICFCTLGSPKLT